MMIAMTIQQAFGVLAAVALTVIVIAAVAVRNSEKKKLFVEGGSINPNHGIVEPPAVKAQLDVIQARARKRRSDYGVKRPKKSEGATTDSGNLNYPPG